MELAWKAEKPFNRLPPLPPDGDLETKIILRQCITARAALAELKQAAELIPNPAMLINTLPILEARASSEIENIVTTADRLFQHLRSEEAGDPATREALRYRHALLEGVEAVGQRPLTMRTAEVVCSRIKGVEMTLRRVPGTALANTATGELVYTPPDPGEPLRRLVANWEQFLHATSELDPLIRMAVAHY